MGASTVVSRILVPIDLTPLGEAKLPVAQEYAKAFDAELLFLHILPPKAVDTDVILPSEAAARAYLDIVVAGMSAVGVRAAPLIRTGQAAASIVEEAWTQQVDLIILGANVRPVLRSVVIGSVADEVVRTAHCPVLLVRPQMDAATPMPLRNFADDAARAGPLRRRSIGLRTVEVGRIIGTVGRSHELGPDFRPLRRRKSDEERFQRIKKVIESGENLPPIELYKLGFGYYVLDGHHRVALARQLDGVEIDAEVTEFIPLADQEAARTFAERRAFERSTGLTDIGAIHPGTYRQLGALIEAFQAEQGMPIYRDAAQRWQWQVYRPLWQRIRERRLVRYFPGDRTSDIVARIAAWWAEQHPESEHEPEAEQVRFPWEEALERFAEMLARERAVPPRGRGTKKTAKATDEPSSP
jgi:nucleotide-binding universal stress UspA family protein